MLNFTTGAHLIEKSPDNQEPTGLLEVIKLNEITNRKVRIDGVYLCKTFSIFPIGKENFLTSLDISDVDTVWTWCGQTSTTPISKYFSEIFSPSDIKLTYNNPNKDFKSIKRL